MLCEKTVIALMQLGKHQSSSSPIFLLGNLELLRMQNFSASASPAAGKESTSTWEMHSTEKSVGLQMAVTLLDELEAKHLGLQGSLISLQYMLADG